MDDVAAALDGAREGGGVPQVALGQLGGQGADVAAVAAGPDEQPQRVAACQERAGDGGADEAGSAGDKGGAGGGGQGCGPWRDGGL